MVLTYIHPTKTDRLPSTGKGIVAYTLPQSMTPLAVIVALTLPFCAAAYIADAPARIRCQSGMNPSG